VTGSKSKNKGRSFENDVASYLSKLYGESFIRAAHSGAYVGGTNSVRKNYLSENQIKSFKGDIIAPDSWKYFNAEAKSYADLPFHQIFQGECKQLETWIDQLITVADENDLNIIFIKLNRKGRFVCVPSNLTWVANNFAYFTTKKHNDWILLNFETFFEHNKDLLKLYATGTLKVINKTSETISTNIENKASNTETIS
jgi:hypothetical protein